jgi:TatD DNase family protein
VKSEEREANSEIKEKQKQLFKQHIELAIKIKKPLMIHARPSKGSMDAYEDVFEILSSYLLLSTTYLLAPHFHFYVGTIDMTEKLLTLGATFSFDGPITFSSDYDEVIQYLPLERIMVETDAPFAAPVSHRGKTCEPWMVKEIVAHIARIKHLDEEEVRLATIVNAKRIFGV